MLFGQKINHFEFLFLIVTIIIFASSCKDEPAAGYNNFIAPSAGTSIASGNEINVKIDFAKGKKIDSVVYLLDSTRIASASDTLGIKIKTDRLKLGNHLITAKIYEGEKSDDITSNIIVLAAKAPDLYTYKVITKFPHDTSAYVEGLEYHDGFFYEGTGEKGKSDLRKVNVQTGKVLQRARLDTALFGEGITLIGNKILQLTWMDKKAFVYDKDTFKQLAEFPYSVGREGWGLTFDGQKIYTSDGSNTIYLMNKDTYQKIGSIEVFDDKGSRDNINELEYIDGKIYANVYLTNDIIIINPENGTIEGKIDLTGLFPSDYFKAGTERDNNVLNGIAYDKAGKRLFVTGKKWPYIFEIKIVKK
ncbi:glutaminyl-peptide cyclotransferase [Pedobacter rhodius]|uniref:Glutaminyl-peptide cyclotransferase n=1 Tax=Pedobacter rhodius TaxID=3004098 RepID=A0ABT4L2C8_9SPHI|nr:glutaminyl-peptide cyclotransferase [Pedobacter sp. SJ11]MCZ4225349.1 glutaminyl-peptide cyclotransferase [Pedobacter sp. SJ11]